MRLLKTRAVHGPNVFHRLPLIVSKLDLGEWADKSSQDMPGFTERLMAKLPNLMEHTCSPGHYGGFHERLLRGTYLAHITEHVALELSQLCDIGVSFGKSVYAGKHGLYEVVTRFKDERGMIECHRQAFELVSALINEQEFDVQASVNKIKRLVARYKMGPSAQAIYDAAKARRIPVQRVGQHSLLRLGYGKHVHHVQTAVTDRTSHIAVDLVQDKALTKEVLERAAIPVPRGESVRTIEGLMDVLSDLKFPVAIKPVDGHHGNGVCLNLANEQEAIRGFEQAKVYASEILIEEMAQGRDYRVLVIDGKLSAAAERIPPFVTGDGISTIETLIQKLNADPSRADGHSGFLTKVEIDESVSITLLKQNLRLTDIPANEQRVYLRENANLSGGGTATDVTDIMHPSVKACCERIARIVGLDICGIDVIHPDISLPVEAGMKVIEVNAGPGLRMHLAPSQGKARPVGEDIVNMLYPPGASSRIPIISVTGTNGKTSVVRMLGKVFQNHNFCVGMTSTDGIWIDQDKIESGDTSGPMSAMKVLSDPKVDIAVLELARGGLRRGGLAYDECDVGVITNIRPDHIGQDGIENLEDLVKIKSLVMAHVKENGTVVLNADDPMALGLMKRPELNRVSRNFTLYSVRADNPALRRHIESGQTAIWFENSEVFVSQGGSIRALGLARRWPVTVDGTAVFQISNALAVVGASIAAGLDEASVFRALEQFRPGLENKGRINLYKAHDMHVIIDYGHNPDAMVAIGEMLRHFEGYKKTAIVGLPGDRKTELLEESGHQMSRCFDKIIFRDDRDLRGRQHGETPAIMAKLFAQNYPQIPFVIGKSEKQAVSESLAAGGAKDILVIFYDNFDAVMEALREYDPIPVDFIPRGSSQSENNMGSNVVQLHTSIYQAKMGNL